MIRPLLLAAALCASVLATSVTFPATPAFAQPASADPASPGPTSSQGDEGEALPPGAPTDSYQLAAWCYGALNEYLVIYDRVVPDLKDIDRMFGTSVVEDKPYKSDMAAARVELKMIGASVTAAEKASPQPLTDQGVAAMKDGRAIWSVAERKSERELARAWLGWALPDRCDINAKDLTRRSLLLGTVLKYNDGAAPPAPSSADTPPAGAGAADPGKADAMGGDAGKSDAPAADPANTDAAAPRVVKESPDAIDAFLAQPREAAPAKAYAEPPDDAAHAPPQPDTPSSDTPPAGAAPQAR